MAIQIYKAGQGRYTRIGTAVSAALVILVLAYYVGVVTEREWPKPPNLVQVDWEGPGMVRQVISETSLAALAVGYYEGAWGGTLPDFAALKPDTTQNAKKLSSVDLTLPNRFGDFALRFSGKLIVPKDGPYTVFLNSEGPGRFYVDGKLVVESEGLRTDSGASARIDLTAGPHDAAVECLHGFGVMAFIYAAKVFATYGIPALIAVVLVALSVWMLNKPNFVDFLIATESEMKKVSWSSRPELLGSTAVVIVTVFLLADVIFLFDFFIIGGMSKGIVIAWHNQDVSSRLYTILHAGAVIFGISFGVRYLLRLRLAAEPRSAAVANVAPVLVFVMLGGLWGFLWVVGVSVPGLGLW